MLKGARKTVHQVFWCNFGKELNVNNSINDDVFVNSRSMESDQHQVYLSDEVLNMKRFLRDVS